MPEVLAGETPPRFSRQEVLAMFRLFERAPATQTPRERFPDYSEQEYALICGAVRRFPDLIRELMRLTDENAMLRRHLQTRVVVERFAADGSN